MIYLYCRISTKKQSIERQIRNLLKAYPNGKIIEEVFTGTTTNRKEFTRLLNKVKKGDTIVFDSVSRMSRNAEQGFEIYENLFLKGVNLVFLKEPHINTDTYKNAMMNCIQMTGTSVDYILKGVNQYLLELAKEQIKIAFEQSEKEVEDLRQRTIEGLESAKLNGKTIGRTKGSKSETKKSKSTKIQIKEMSKDFDGTLKDTEIMDLLHIARNTYYKYKRELKEEL